MKILVACEESQRVCKAFRDKGHIAFSCDIIPCSGGHPEYHIMQDVIPLLKGNCTFTTESGYRYYIDKWDMIIAFPPCTHLAVSGAMHFSKKRESGVQKEAIEFFGEFLKAPCDRVVIELEYFEWTDKNGKKKRQPLWYYEALKYGKDRAKIRSKTFPGIARAMADQWG